MSQAVGFISRGALMYSGIYALWGLQRITHTLHSIRLARCAT